MDPFTIEVFTLWGISATVVGIRTYARWSTVGIREFQVDDYLMIVACVGRFTAPVRFSCGLSFIPANIRMARWYTASKQVQDTVLEPFLGEWQIME